MPFPCLIRTGMELVSWMTLLYHYMYMQAGRVLHSTAAAIAAIPFINVEQGKRQGPRFEPSLPLGLSREGALCLGAKHVHDQGSCLPVAEAVTPAALDGAAPPTPRDCIIMPWPNSQCTPYPISLCRESRKRRTNSELMER
ncbi:hypothetical protein CGRA01v4_02526 [Colletotrichum graminicola]|nr:hypothetical protein CGRA01v4_02526 [Colletotrichum graminicola]